MASQRTAFPFHVRDGRCDLTAMRAIGAESHQRPAPHPRQNLRGACGYSVPGMQKSRQAAAPHPSMTGTCEKPATDTTSLPHRCPHGYTITTTKGARCP